MAIDITKVLFYSNIDTFKNVEPHVTGNLAIPSTSYAAGQTKTYTQSFPINRANMVAQTMTEFSFDPNKWHVTRTTLDVNTYFRATFAFYMNGANMTLRIVTWNADGVTARTCPAWNVDYVVKLFAAPFE